MPSLQSSGRYHIKKALKQNATDKYFLDNADKNNEKYVQKLIIRYSLNICKVLD
jgi:hypothetical protein